MAPHRRQDRPEAIPGSGAASPMARWRPCSRRSARADEWGIRDLAAHTGLPRSAVHRMRPRDGPPGHARGRRRSAGRFRVGPALARLSVLLAERLDVRAVARPIMERAAAELDETLVLSLYSPARRQFRAIDAVESSQPIRYIWGPLARSGATSTPARAARASSRSCPTTSGTPSWTRCPIPVPGPVPHVDVASCARSCDASRELAATSSATASGSRARWASPPPSATRPGGSSGTSCSAGPTTATTRTRRHVRRDS